ncbi:MAG: ATP synthase F1 subunit delta [Flavobacteriaceae bacterium]|nr:ATP synthase F1 subunit delta [Flavobacteriaceae bacterium]
MKVSIVGIRYAKALYSYANQKNHTCEFVSDCVFLDKIIAQSIQVQDLLRFSPFSLEKRKKALLGMLNNPNQITVKMLDLLTQNNRFELLQSILREIYKLDLKAKRKTIVKVTTAVELKGNLKDQVYQTINKFIDGKVDLINVIEPKIIGGFVLNYEDLQYDASITNKVNSIKNAIVQ